MYLDFGPLPTVDFVDILGDPKQKIGARANEAVDPYNLRDLRVLLVECLKINVASVDISEMGSKNWGMCK